MPLHVPVELALGIGASLDTASALQHADSVSRLFQFALSWNAFAGLAVIFALFPIIAWLLARMAHMQAARCVPSFFLPLCTISPQTADSYDADARTRRRAH
jgi:hypothetical protein